MGGMTWSEHCEAVAAGLPGFPIVEVVWEDAIAYALDWEEDVNSDLETTTTVGYLVSETKRALTLVSVINTRHVAHGIVIPKPVLKRRIL